MKFTRTPRFPALDFAPRQSGPWWLVVALLASGLALAAGASEWMALRRTRADNEAAWSALLRQQASPSTVVSVKPLPKELIQGVNDAIMDLNTPWPSLLGAIESVRPDAISLTLLEPQAREQRVRISATGESMDALVDFMESLGRTAPFDSALPIRQEVTAPTVATGNTAPALSLRRHQLTFELHWKTLP